SSQCGAQSGSRGEPVRQPGGCRQSGGQAQRSGGAEPVCRREPSRRGQPEPDRPEPNTAGTQLAPGKRRQEDRTAASRVENSALRDTGPAAVPGQAAANLL